MNDAPAHPSLQALDRTAWASIDAQEATFLELWSGFGDLTRKAEAADDVEAAAACRLLAGISSLITANDQMHDPYAPMAQFQGRRSFVPDDMTNVDLDFIAELIPRVASARLVARCNDILWIRRHGTQPHEAGRRAVISWLRVGMDTGESWYLEDEDNWPRYLHIARQLKLKEELQAACDMLSKAFWEADARRSLDLVDLLLDTGLPDRSEWARVAERLTTLATDTDGGTLRRELSTYAAKLYKRLGNADAEAAAQYEVVKWWMAEADRRLKGSALSAVALYQSALQSLRLISNKQRARLDISGLASDIAKLIRSSGVSALDEMRPITGGSIDLRAEAEQVQAAVSGEDAAYATLLLVGAVPYVVEGDERREAEKRLAESAIMSIVSTQHLAADGRVVHNAAPEEDGPWGGYSGKLWDEMVQVFDDIHVQWAVKGRILPALEVLTLEHRIRVRDCAVVARCSPIVPSGREQTVARALAAGFNYDFTAALYMLTPQIEHIVRSALNELGISTTTMGDRVEQEIGLSSLLAIPEVVEVFGTDIVFELRALFGGPIGANMRNAVAHGLLSDGEAVSLHAVYAWWFLLRLVYIPYWNGLNHEGPDHGEFDS
ncbi:DUF4209 domain-containing protein [Curtobacterium sp. VKM Ac-1393]|uniref:DUF4209 domain-containing protein n=1 Tax=Curtobacterium sp. VKM Ac-1393 TaxID=2783814 RepID=UPI00188CB67E|nr:DUF4209 domain-containing protein [Curtobacterium sp. VKM Ac-1393]MBF4608934.1 DUF4209 domain-containing protein [Curtobacterium sp. VKM Ac-1393]